MPHSYLSHVTDARKAIVRPVGIDQGRVTLNHHSSVRTDLLLEAVGFKFNRREQAYVGSRFQLTKFERLADAGWYADGSVAFVNDRRVLKHNELLSASEAVDHVAAYDMLVTPPARCNRTLELFA